jgi:hypothetical protein
MPLTRPRRGSVAGALSEIGASASARWAALLPGQSRALFAGFRGHSTDLRLREIRCLAETRTRGGHHRLDGAPRLFLK